MKGSQAETCVEGPDTPPPPSQSLSALPQQNWLYIGTIKELILWPKYKYCRDFSLLFKFIDTKKK